MDILSAHHKKSSGFNPFLSAATSFLFGSFPPLVSSQGEVFLWLKDLRLKIPCDLIRLTQDPCVAATPGERSPKKPSSGVASFIGQGVFMKLLAGVVVFASIFGAIPFLLFAHLPAYAAVSINLLVSGLILGLMSNASKEQERPARPLTTEELIRLMKR